MSATETFNGPRMAVQHHQGQGGAEVGELLVREERQAPVMIALLRETQRNVRAMETGDMRAGRVVTANIIELCSAGHMPKQTRKASALCGFRSEAGATRFLKVAAAALAGVTAVIVPLRRPTDPPKSIPDAKTYKSWPDAVAAEGITACYKAAQTALKDATAVPTRREAFGKAVYSRIVALHRLRALGASDPVATMLDGRLMSQMDCEAFYTGPDGDALMVRGTSWDDVMAELLGADASDTDNV